MSLRAQSKESPGCSQPLMVRQGSTKSGWPPLRKNTSSSDCYASSRHHDDVAGPEQVISFAAFVNHVVIIDDSDLLLAIGIPDKFYLSGRGKGCKPPRHRQRFQYRHVATQGGSARPAHIPHDGELG